MSYPLTPSPVYLLVSGYTGRQNGRDPRPGPQPLRPRPHPLLLLGPLLRDQTLGISKKRDFFCRSLSWCHPISSVLSENQLQSLSLLVFNTVITRVFSLFVSIDPLPRVSSVLRICGQTDRRRARPTPEAAPAADLVHLEAARLFLKVCSLGATIQFPLVDIFCSIPSLHSLPSNMSSLDLTSKHAADDKCRCITCSYSSTSSTSTAPPSGVRS